MLDKKNKINEKREYIQKEGGWMKLKRLEKQYRKNIILFYLNTTWGGGLSIRVRRKSNDSFLHLFTFQSK